jgi:hypothetical protein
MLRVQPEMSRRPEIGQLERRVLMIPAEESHERIDRAVLIGDGAGARDGSAIRRTTRQQRNHREGAGGVEMASSHSGTPLQKRGLPGSATASTALECRTSQSDNRSSCATADPPVVGCRPHQVIVDVDVGSHLPPPMCKLPDSCVSVNHVTSATRHDGRRHRPRGNRARQTGP